MAKMHQTTIRFSDDLWALLEHEAALAGVSAAQFIRDAALGRIAYSAGRRGDDDINRVFALVGGQRDMPAQPATAHAARDSAHAGHESSEAVWAQGRLARERARELRAAAQALPKNPAS